MDTHERRADVLSFTVHSGDVMRCVLEQGNGCCVAKSAHRPLTCSEMQSMTHSLNITH